jgi:hypothetical protein
LAKRPTGSPLALQAAQYKHDMKHKKIEATIQTVWDATISVEFGTARLCDQHLVEQARGIGRRLAPKALEDIHRRMQSSDGFARREANSECCLIIDRTRS